MLVTTQSGQATGSVTVSPGTVLPIRSGRQGGDLIVSELHGRYYEQTYNGNVFSVCNQAAVTTTAGLATTFTGLAVGNPAGSGVNLIINKYTVGQVAVSVAGTVGIMGGAGVVAASLIPQPRLLGATGATASKATASAGATISTPVLILACASVGSVATTGYSLQAGVTVDLEGSLIVPPGSFIASYTTAACTSAFVFGFAWEEVPI